jgi:glycerate kinase
MIFRRVEPALVDLAHLDLAPLRATSGSVKIIVASDVDNPLLGANGAAAVFGPQKGAGPQELETLERGMRHWSQLVSEATGRNDTERPGPVLRVVQDTQRWLCSMRRSGLVSN